MCGISLIIENAQVCIGNAPPAASEVAKPAYTLKDIQTRLHNRGPDAIHTHTIRTGKESNPIRISFVASVLFVRGTEPTPQPYGDEKGNLLLWNGEIFSGIDVLPNENDTRVLFNTLVAQGDNSVMDTLSKIQGPWAFAFWHAEHKKLWFGRDPLGRRSLVVHQEPSAFVISSIASFPDQKEISPHWEEVNTYGLFCIDFGTGDPYFPKLEVVPRHGSNAQVGLGFVSSADDVEDDDESTPAAKQNNQPTNSKNTTITNSDATTTNSNNSTPTSKPDATSTNSNNSTHTLNSNYNTNLNFTPTTTTSPNIAASAGDSTHSQLSFFPFGKRAQVINPPGDFVPSLQEFELAKKDFMAILSESVRVRVANLPPSTAIYGTDHITQSRLGILFSGGLDSMVIAALADLHVPKEEPIDLINVSFGDSATVDFDKVPDRQNGINGLYELQKVSTRKWNLLKVNITHTDLEFACKNNVYFLTYPATTIMDITIGAALWFAAKGKGIKYIFSSIILIFFCITYTFYYFFSCLLFVFSPILVAFFNLLYIFFHFSF
eukprot:Phypoly_transcript_04023.p1 GENE.Phypoly_transcript_04023~~Phypoly_transcript_04023.p1  ORF type:complete len:548 (+),score=71.01 Phypoly_transcript_04023:131-1774(+)